MKFTKPSKKLKKICLCLCVLRLSKGQFTLVFINKHYKKNKEHSKADPGPVLGATVAWLSAVTCCNAVLVSVQ